MARNRLELVSYRTKSGEVVWQMRGTVNGQRIRESTGTSNKREAELKARDREAKALKVRRKWEKGERTFAMVAGEYLKRGGRDGNGGEARFLVPIIKHFGPDRAVGDITPGDVRDMAIELYPDGSGGTRNRNAITPAAAVINYGAERGWNHPIRVKRFPEPKTIKKAVDREWVDKFMAHCEHPGIRAMQLVTFVTGARRSDLMRMYRKNFDHKARTVTVYDSKNGDPHVFRLTKEAADEVNKLSYVGQLFGIPYVWFIYPVIRETCKKARIPYTPPHQSGRHSFATNMITEKGVDVRTVADLANWKSLSLLMERYVHSKQQKAAVELLEPSKPRAAKVKATLIKVRRLKR